MDLLSFAIGMRTALLQCGQLAMALQGRVEAERKDPDSPAQQSTSVTAIDRLCQEIILLRAHELSPEIEVYSEEIGSAPEALLALFRANHHRYVLIVDPVDGTDDLISGANTFGHMLGLLDQESGRMALGMIYLPGAQALYWAVRGMGAYEEHGLFGAPRPLRGRSPRRTVGDIKRLSADDRERIHGAGFDLVPEESHSAAHELMRVARGELGASVMRDFHGHDNAMASVIVETMGGLALDDRGRAVEYTRDMPRRPLMVLSLEPDYALTLHAALEESGEM